MTDKHEVALAAAFATAIRKIGIATFKQSSMFGSTQRRDHVQLKKAA